MRRFVFDQQPDVTAGDELPTPVVEAPTWLLEAPPDDRAPVGGNSTPVTAERADSGVERTEASILGVGPRLVAAALPDVVVPLPLAPVDPDKEDVPVVRPLKLPCPHGEVAGRPTTVPELLLV